MPRVLVTFEAELTEEQLEDLESADPALLYEYASELVEEIVEGTLTYGTEQNS
jgi:hypothetical protein